MITWVTVWVLTVANYDAKSSYQLTYASQKTCLQQLKNHESKEKRPWIVRCDFQQIPVVTK